MKRRYNTYYLFLFTYIATSYFFINSIAAKQLFALSILNVTLTLDTMIPYKSSYVWLYITYFPMLLMPVFFKLESVQWKPFLISSFGITFLSHAFFILFPVLGPRPPITEAQNINDVLMKWLYSADLPYNCFPSLHASHATFIAFFVTCFTGMSRYFKGLLIFFAAGVWVSAVVIKQHWVLDIVSGIALAAAALFFCKFYTNHKAARH